MKYRDDLIRIATEVAPFFLKQEVSPLYDDGRAGEWKNLSDAIGQAAMMSKQFAVNLLDEVQAEVDDVVVGESYEAWKMDGSTTSEAIGELAKATHAVSGAITMPGALMHPGHDASGGAVGSLTEAVMGATAGLVKIADMIDGLVSTLDANSEIRNRGE